MTYIAIKIYNIIYITCSYTLLWKQASVTKLYNQLLLKIVQINSLLKRECYLVMLFTANLNVIVF